MAHSAVLHITLSVLVLNSLCYRTLAPHFKECTWKQAEAKDEGVIRTCEFNKCHDHTLFYVYYSGTIRTVGSSACCNRWYFTFNNAECLSPGAIDGALYVKGQVHKHDHGHIEGYCGGIPAGNIQVKINVGRCVGTSYRLGDAQTGSLGTTSRIFIEEILPSDYSKTRCYGK